MTLPTFSIIVAQTEHGGIGLNGGMPWKISCDLKFFRKVTCNLGNESNQSSVITNNDDSKSNSNSNNRNVVIMGRKTWESIGKVPLKNRINLVLSKHLQSSDLKEQKDVYFFTSLTESLTFLANQPYINNIFVIGGSQIYKEALILNQQYLNTHGKELLKVIYITIIKRLDGTGIAVDTFFPSSEVDLLNGYVKHHLDTVEENGYSCDFFQYTPHPNKEEQQYLSLIKRILTQGTFKMDRTGTGTYSLWGNQLRFNLREGYLPLLTTRRLFFKGIVEELLWFLSGSTNVAHLRERGVKIWDGNVSRDALDKLGFFDREVDDLGPGYGFQWRHFGAKYISMHHDYKGQGVDQIKEAIHMIKNSPNSRRIVVSAWNPVDVKETSLPPCHCWFQFDVKGNELSTSMTMRSTDVGLGLPFNIASYALLTFMMAQVCNLKPGELVISTNDTHVYSNHTDALKEQIKRNPHPFPKIILNSDVTDIDSFKFSDFQLVDYVFHPHIKMEMAV